MSSALTGELVYGSVATRREVCVVHHGWKYDVNGNCTEIPSEPEESGLCNRIKLTAYPMIEKGGVVWVYMGPNEHMP